MFSRHAVILTEMLTGIIRERDGLELGNEHVMSWTVVWQPRWKEALDTSPIDASTQFSFSYLRLSSRLERFQRYQELVEPDSVEFEIDDSGEFDSVTKT